MSGEDKSGPSAMEGGGFYNRNSALQAAGIARLLPFWEAACRTVEIGAESLVIVDYGSSQGRNSMAPMRMAIEELRRRTGTETPVEVIHTDLPANDFPSLFTALQDESNSYLSGTFNIFPAAIGRSYFDPLLPPGRVHLGWNTFSLHWMSGSPADAPDHLLAGLSQSFEVARAVSVQQAIEWRRFLEVRSREMREGGKLLSAFACRAKDGNTGWEWLCGELWAAILDMGKAGLLSKGNRVESQFLLAGVRSKRLKRHSLRLGVLLTWSSNVLKFSESWTPFGTSFRARATGDSSARDTPT